MRGVGEYIAVIYSKWITANSFHYVTQTHTHTTHLLSDYFSIYMMFGSKQKCSMELTRVELVNQAFTVPELTSWKAQRGNVVLTERPTHTCKNKSHLMHWFRHQCISVEIYWCCWRFSMGNKKLIENETKSPEAETCRWFGCFVPL